MVPKGLTHSATGIEMNTSQLTGSFHNYIARSLLLILATACIPAKTLAAEQLTLGIHPYKSPQKLLKIYRPLANIIEKQIQRPVKLVIAKDYATHIHQIGNNRLDIAYMGPASYVQMVNQFGEKKLLARQAINNKPTFQGKIIIRNASPINTLNDLIGKRFAFGDPSSTMSHLVPRYMLIKNNITRDKLDKIEFLGSHDNVALGVLSGDYDAGAVKEAVYYKYKSRGIKALATTPALSEHVFVAGNHLSNTLSNKIKHILLNLKNTREGREAMKKIKKKMTAMLPAEDGDYDNLRDILATLKQHNIIK